MFNDKYNYSLNGIEHEIILNNNIKINLKPLNEKILVSNKYLLKYIHDLFTYHNIEYSLLNHSLLGVYVFNGINIFNNTIELCTIDSNFIKLNKLKNEIINDDFSIDFYDYDDIKYFKISTIFFDNIKVSVHIYPLNNDDITNKLTYKTFDNKFMVHDFYDIYPIKKNTFEEFEISVPNKINKVLQQYNFNLNYICFTNKKEDNKIIEDIEKVQTLNTIITDNINNFISVIKPLLF